jgi:class 3 adenylate cyclase
LKHFLPHFIQENYRHSLLQGHVRAFTMFVDLSGFTRLTEKLMQQGPEGAEELSYILNYIFQPTVTLVYEQGGFIPYFAGDSFTAIFPVPGASDARGATPATVEEAGMAVWSTAQATIQRFLREQEEADSLLRDHKIGIKIGLSQGDVEWGIVGNRRKGYYFRGMPIEGCSQAQVRAGSQEIVCDAAFLGSAPPLPAPAKPLGNGFFRLDPGQMKVEKRGVRKIKLPKPDPAIATDFMPKEAFAEGNAGEFRNVVSVFLSFTGVDTHEALDHFTSIVLDQSLNFGGYFKEIDFGDKGGVMFCLFGAPVSFENNTERALEFITAVQEELQHLETSPARVIASAFHASGLAFTGVIGSTSVASMPQWAPASTWRPRLMMAKAEWGEVMADENVQHNRNFKFAFGARGDYKGFEKALPTYLLSGRNLAAGPVFPANTIGRATEFRKP